MVPLTTIFLHMMIMMMMMMQFVLLLHQNVTVNMTMYTITHDLLLLSNRSFGDKSGPPALPDLESEGGDPNGEECDLGEEEKQEEVEESPCGETRTDEACCGIEELSLTVQEEQEDERSIEEDEQEDQKTTQGILYRNMF